MIGNCVLDVEKSGVGRSRKMLYLVVFWWLMLVGGYCLCVGGKFLVVIIWWIVWCVGCFYLWLDVNFVVEILVGDG